MGKNSTSFKEGNTFGKGRPKGCPNRTTEQMREIIKMVIDNNLENLEQDLEDMSASKRWAIIEKLNKYIMPALNKNENITDLSAGLNIRISYEDEQKGRVGGTLLIEDENNA